MAFGDMASCSIILNTTISLRKIPVKSSALLIHEAKISKFIAEVNYISYNNQSKQTMIGITMLSFTNGPQKNDMQIPRQQSSWGQHGAHLGPVGPSWASCSPHEPCYQGTHCVIEIGHVSSWWFDESSPATPSKSRLKLNMYEYRYIMAIVLASVRYHISSYSSIRYFNGIKSCIHNAISMNT